MDMAVDVSKWPDILVDNKRLFFIREWASPNCRQSELQTVNNHFQSTNKVDTFRHFIITVSWPNRGIIDHRWLVYSRTTDKVFCFCYKLFSCARNKFSQSGCFDWKHLSDYIRDHETSVPHMQACLSWIDMENRLNKGNTIDEEMQRQIEAERCHCHAVLQSLWQQ